jgi:hypothetical protein
MAEMLADLPVVSMTSSRHLFSILGLRNPGDRARPSGREARRESGGAS